MIGFLPENTGMNPKLERFAFGLILAPLAPLAGLLVGWWCTYALLPEKWIPLGALSGLVSGILADSLILNKLLDRAIHLGRLFWAAVFLFYTVGVFGFFMGVPVFNALLSIPVGFVAGAKLAEQRADPIQVRKMAGWTARVTTSVMVFVCAASALLALLSKSTASDLQGMLGLGFEVTQGMVIGLILVGGAALLVVSYGLTIISVRFSYKFTQHKV